MLSRTRCIGDRILASRPEQRSMRYEDPMNVKSLWGRSNITLRYYELPGVIRYSIKSGNRRVTCNAYYRLLPSRFQQVIGHRTTSILEA
ncbi:hypothetical protein AVEN_82933-1 [Araneus ventricosus]|uniref:Uncharacterized protein n=1 Tax=Araneus ventricosus TaxID=182803 RepID=A0A4Y2CWM4_ARAVE|nr:hypothetical protein AVEN_82933-1 [Araneus ventricosus]